MEEREISLKELFDVIWGGKFLIILITLIFFIIGTSASFIMDAKSTKMSMIVSLTWDGIEEGKNPNGTSYDYYDIISPVNIKNTNLELGLELDVAKVRRSIDVSPIVPSDIINIAQAELKDGNTYNYHATNYLITLNNKALNLNKSTANDYLLTLFNNYKTYFADKYISLNGISSTLKSDYSDYEYVEILDILKSQIALIKSPILKYSLENPEFYSTENGMSFETILNNIDLINSIDISRAESYVFNYLLSKDKEDLIISYEYKIGQTELLLNKKQAEVTSIKNLITNYSGSSTIIFPGINEGENSFEINQGYDNLVMLAQQAEVEAITFEKDLEYYNLILSRLQGTDPQFTITPEKQAEVSVKLEELISDTNDNLLDWVDLGNQLINEYRETINDNSMLVLVTPAPYGGVNKLLYIAASIAIGGMISLGIVLFRHDWDKKTV